MSTVSFSERFEGPFPGAANGGVVAGTLAGVLGADAGAPIEVRLVRPVPVAVELDVVSEDGGVALRRHDELLATAAAVPDPPPEGTVVGLDEAEAAQRSPVVPTATHPAAGCFVCGPANPRGLNLQPGWVDGRAVAATVWWPPAELADERGLLPPRFVWAALDCPSWYGGTEGRMALLGTIRGCQVADLRAGEPVVVTGWGAGESGRKVFAGAAIHTPDGGLVASSSAIWIYPRQA